MLLQLLMKERAVRQTGQGIVTGCMSEITGESMEIATKFGHVRIKVAKATGRRSLLKARPEYRDCKRLAEETGLPLPTIMREVEQRMRRLRC